MNKDRFKDRLSEELLSIDGNTDDLQPLKDNVSILSKVLLDAVVYMIETENIKLPLDKQNGLEIIIEDNIRSFINYGHALPLDEEKK